MARHEWVDADRAQELYRRHEFFDIVDATVIQDELPFPRWVISSSHGFVVRIFDQESSIVREIDYKPIKGRLFRSAVVDQGFPDGRQRWMQVQVKPDGSGVVRTRRSNPDEQVVKEFTGFDTTSLWLPVPEFGDWSALTDPGPAASEMAEQVGAS